MTGDVKLLVAGLVLVLVAGLAWLALAPPPARPRPVLGYVEAERPRPASIHGGMTPAFKLPWWK